MCSANKRVKVLNINKKTNVLNINKKTNVLNINKKTNVLNINKKTNVSNKKTDTLNKKVIIFNTCIFNILEFLEKNDVTKRQLIITLSNSKKHSANRIKEALMYTISYEYVNLHKPKWQTLCYLTPKGTSRLQELRLR